MKMSNKVYDTLKWIVLLLIPAVGSLYFSLASIWALPYGEQIVGTLSVVNTFLGAILKISTNAYNKSNEDT